MQSLFFDTSNILIYQCPSLKKQLFLLKKREKDAVCGSVGHHYFEEKMRPIFCVHFFPGKTRGRKNYFKAFSTP